MGEIVVASHGERPIQPDVVVRLYRQAEWWPERSAETVGALLATSPSVGAWADSALVGFARGITDGRERAYLEDVVVHEEHRGRGIGTRIVERLVADLDVEVTTLFCSVRLAPFYERLGFEPTRQIALHRRR